MDKIIITLFIVFAFCIRANCAEVENNNFTIKSFKYYSSSVNENVNKTYQPVELYITKKNYCLQSSMKKEYVVRKYTIKNISDKPINIEFEKGTDLDSAVSRTKYLRKISQSKTAFLIPLQDGYNDAYEMIGANNGILFIGGICSSVYNFGIKFPVYICKSIYNVIAGPFYYFNNKKDDELIEKEIYFIKSIITDTPDNYTLKSNESIQVRNLFQDWDYPSVKAVIKDKGLYKFEIK